MPLETLEMAVPFSLFLALRYMKPRRSFVSVVTLISMLGVLLGVAILVIVLSVMTGFDDMWRDKILGFSAHITVMRTSRVIDDDQELARRISQVKGVTDVSPHVQTLVLMRNQNRISAPFVLGMSPTPTGIAGRIADSITQGEFDIADDKMILGWDLAAQLGVSLGDTVLVYSPKNVVNRDEIYLPEEFTVSGIFDLGMWEFDSRFALTSMDAARDLYGLEGGAVAMRVSTDDPFKAAVYADNIVAALGPGYKALTWMDLNRVLFDALRVEKGVMFMLLVFITVVAIFCITNTLIVIAVHKTREIGLLKAMGFPSSRIMGVFIWHGLIQCVLGTIAGISTGMLVLHFRNEIVTWLSSRMNIELFPKAVYQLSQIPSHTSWQDVATIAGLVFVFCTLASIIPAARAARLDPVEAIRNE